MTEMAIAEQQAVAAKADGHYLTFLLGDEAYGIEILKVQEIKGYATITPIPNTPKFIRGMMNLRGTVIPVVDLRARFGMPEVEYNKFTVIVVVTVGEKTIGLIVDAVADVVDVPRSEMRLPPDMGPRVDLRFMTGMATVGDKLTVLLDVDKLLTDDDAAAIAGVSE